MMIDPKERGEFQAKGFALLDNIYSAKEIDAISRAIERKEDGGENFRRSTDLFAIRQFLKEVPELTDLLFTPALKNIIAAFAGDDFFVVKSIYFDKPETSNWYVSYHQDLTISVSEKKNIEGYGPWTVKKDQYAVQPPIGILENIVTIRIHLDDTDEHNGALRIIPGSHLHEVVRSENIDRDPSEEVSCAVKAGGVMLMKPLLLHSSGRTVDNRRRRVIHIEMSNAELHPDLHWAERMFVDP